MIYRFIGFLMSSWGLMVMFSWYNHLTEFIQMPYGAAVMQFNTAFCFMCLGFTRLFNSKSPLYIVFIFSGISLLQDITQINLGVDTLLFRDVGLISPVEPARMSEATSLFFIICSVFGLVYPKMPEITRIAYVFVSALSAFFIIAYIPPFRAHIGVEITSISISLMTAFLFFMYTSSSVIREILYVDVHK